MTDVSSGARGAVFWVFVLATTIVAVAGLQWFAPEQTVRPIAERFSCDGTVRIRAASSDEVQGVFAEVDCLHGVRAEDVTGLTMFMLGIPVVVVLGAAFVVGRRLVAPEGGSRIRHTPA